MKSMCVKVWVTVDEEFSTVDVEDAFENLDADGIYVDDVYAEEEDR